MISIVFHLKWESNRLSASPLPLSFKTQDILKVMFQRPRVLPLLRNKEGIFSGQNREGKKSVTSSVPGQSNLSRDENLMKVDHPIIKHV